MTEMLLCVVILLLGCDIVLDLAMYRRTRGKEREARRDTAAQEAMDQATEAEARRSQAMDEGFDNLMRYSIYEKDGFGGTL